LGAVARVASLHRYPVKSLHGEPMTALELDRRGCVGDRLWSVRTSSGKIGSGKNTRRFAAIDGLLQLRAEHRDGRVLVTFPDGTSCFTDADAAVDQLSGHFGQPLRFELEQADSHFDDGPVSLVGLASVAAVSSARGDAVDPRRFRPNIVLETARAFVEDSWVGRQLEVGTALLEVTLQSARCVMVDMQTADLPAQPGNLKTTGRLNSACLGVIAQVVSPGRVEVGDAVRLCAPALG
jgi:uncharacterized protein